MRIVDIEGLYVSESTIFRDLKRERANMQLDALRYSLVNNAWVVNLKWKGEGYLIKSKGIGLLE